MRRRAKGQALECKDSPLRCTDRPGAIGWYHHTRANVTCGTPLTFPNWLHVLHSTVLCCVVCWWLLASLLVECQKHALAVSGVETRASKPDGRMLADACLSDSLGEAKIDSKYLVTRGQHIGSMSLADRRRPSAGESVNCAHGNHICGRRKKKNS